MGLPKHHSTPALQPAAVSTDSPGRHLGDLARSDARWSVHLEVRPPADARGFRDGEPVAARLHFVDESRHRVTAWIFLECSEQDVLARFNEFSPTELWKMLESLA